jgi:hypothetical protein
LFSAAPHFDPEFGRAASSVFPTAGKNNTKQVVEETHYEKMQCSESGGKGKTPEALALRAAGRVERLSKQFSGAGR